jgi:hypothetical protein
MGPYRVRRGSAVFYVVIIGAIATCLSALVILSVR